MFRFRLDKTAKTGQLISGRICNLDCIWCHHDYFNHSDSHRCAISNEMFADSIVRVIAAAKVEEAVVRIGGNGEPTLVGCAELVELIELLRQIPQVKSIRMTTNGVLLEEMTRPLRDAGLDVVTISLNSLDPEIYRFYAGSYCLERVLSSLEASLAVGLITRVNVIYCRLNARELGDFLDLAQRNRSLTLKFFDLIPASQLDARLYLPLDQLEERLASYAYQIEELGDAYPCREYHLTGGGTIQVKTTQKNNCPNLACPARRKCLEGCRSSIRIRLDGILQPCGVRTDNIVDLFSSGITPAQIRKALRSGGKL